MSRVLPLLIAAALVGSLLASERGASADDAATPSPAALSPAEVRAVIMPSGKSDLASATLVGRSGQIYRPAAGGGWKREGRGGVACRVSTAMEVGGQLWAMCSQAPLFSRRGGVWSAHPLANRGRTRSAHLSRAPLFSVGRHLYTWKGGSWQRVASAPGRITDLLASSATRGLALTTRRELLRLSGKSWKTLVDAPKRRERDVDSPSRLFGSAKHAFVVLESGTIMAVTSSGVAAVTLPSGVSSYGVGGSCSTPSGAVTTIGRARRGTSSEVMLLSWSGRAATSAGSAPVLADGEHIGILHCQGKELLVSTDRGRVLVRDESGAWSQKRLDPNPPPQTVTPVPGAAPAPTR